MPSNPQLIQLFYYAIHSILFHRNVYTREEFDISPKFGQTQYIVAENAVRSYIDTFLLQVDEWLEKREITHVVLVILAKDDGRTLERWTFDVQQHTSEIAVLNVLKQIVAATTSLPDLPSPAVFTLQTYVQEEAARRVTNAGILASEPELMMDDWRDVTEDGPLPFGEGVETQQTFLRGVTTNESDVNLLLTALDD